MMILVLRDESILTSREYKFTIYIKNGENIYSYTTSSIDGTLLLDGNFYTSDDFINFINLYSLSNSKISVRLQDARFDNEILRFDFSEKDVDYFYKLSSFYKKLKFN